MEVMDLGRKSYSAVLALQKELVEKRAAGHIPDTLILVEHDPVYTVGRAGAAKSQEVASGASSGEALSTNDVVPQSIRVRKGEEVPVVEVERGGKITFHGPGQLVGYPIFGIAHRDLRRFLRELEWALMDAVNEVAGLDVRPCPESLLLEPGQLQTGVWVHDRKLASIGIAVRKWVSYHGFAINFTTDLRYFAAVQPCGFNGNIMTTVERELGDVAERSAVYTKIRERIIERFRRLSSEMGARAGAGPSPNLDRKSDLTIS